MRRGCSEPWKGNIEGRLVDLHMSVLHNSFVTNIDLRNVILLHESCPETFWVVTW